MQRISPPAAVAAALLVNAAYAVLLGFAHVVPRYDCLVFPVVAGLTAWLLGNAPGRGALVGFLGASTLLALGVLAHLWTTGHEGRSAILLGIVPYSDAGAFYADAERMLYGLRFGESSRRPLYVAVFGAILRWSGDDLRRALLVQTLAYGASMGLCAREALRLHGRAAAGIVFAVSFFWVRRFTGFVATEALAFPLGALGFALLVRVVDRAAEAPRESTWAFGAAVMSVTLGLIARPGSLLVVPALLLWTRWAFAGKWRGIALGAGLGGLAIALVLTWTITARLSSGATFGDYPAIVYALLHRGDLYSAVLDHPELASIDPGHRGGAIFAILAADVRREPSLLVLGPGEALVSFFVGPHGLFSFVWTNPDDHVLENGPLVRQLVAQQGYLGPVRHWVHELGPMSLVNAVVMSALGAAFVVAMVAALVKLIRRRREPRERLLLFVMGGIVASAVFAPTWIGEGMQMQTAIFAFVPAALALGLFRAEPSLDEAPPLRPLAWLTVALPAVLGLGVAATCAFPWSVDRTGCGLGLVAARLSPSTRTILRGAEAPTPNERSLATNLDFLARHNPELVASVKAVARVGDAVEVVYDACAERTRIVFGPPELLPDSHEWATLRFEPQKEPNVGRISAP